MLVKVFYKMRPLTALSNFLFDKVLIAEKPPKLRPNTKIGMFYFSASSIALLIIAWESFTISCSLGGEFPSL